MKSNDMLRQAKGTLDNITELVSRLAALERERTTASDALDDACLRMATALRVKLGECPLKDVTAAAERMGARHRELEAGLRHVLTAITDPRFPAAAMGDARIELEQLVGETDAREKTPAKEA